MQLVGQDLVGEAAREDGDRVEGEGAADEAGHGGAFGKVRAREELRDRTVGLEPLAGSEPASQARMHVQLALGRQRSLVDADLPGVSTLRATISPLRSMNVTSKDGMRTA